MKSLVKHSLWALLLTSHPALAAENAKGEAQCIVPSELPYASKALQDVIAFRHELAEKSKTLQELAVSFGDSSEQGGPSKAALATGEIIERLDDVGLQFKTALEKSDDLENLPLILAQAQGRLVAALTKWRPLKRLDLSEAQNAKVLCLEEEVRALNEKLKTLIAGFPR